MNKLLFVTAWLLFTLVLNIQAAPGELQRQILGVDLNMIKDAVHKRLGEIGTFVRNEEKQQEVWQVRNESFSHLLIGFGKEERLRYVTAVAREDKEAKRVEYAQIGDVKRARQAGDPGINNFNYQWDLPAEKGSPHMLVIAAGRDPKFLTTYTLKSLDVTPVPEKD